MSAVMKVLNFQLRALYYTHVKLSYFNNFSDKPFLNMSLEFALATRFWFQDARGDASIVLPIQLFLLTFGWTMFSSTGGKGCWVAVMGAPSQSPSASSEASGIAIRWRRLGRTGLSENVRPISIHQLKGRKAVGPPGG